MCTNNANEQFNTPNQLRKLLRLPSGQYIENAYHTIARTCRQSSSVEVRLRVVNEITVTGVDTCVQRHVGCLLKANVTL